MVMQVTMLDKRGRITLGRRMEKRYGKRFVIVPAKNEIILMPAPFKDPLKGLEELGRKSGINKYSRTQLKKIAQGEADREASSNLHW